MMVKRIEKCLVSSIQFQGKTKDQETEEARSEATSSKEGHGRLARVSRERGRPARFEDGEDYGTAKERQWTRNEKRNKYLPRRLEVVI
jgi:hypothetical protein